MTDGLFICPPPIDPEGEIVSELIRMGFWNNITLNDLAKIDPEVEAAIHPKPGFWDELESSDPLPEWCSPDWVGPWEGGQDDATQPTD